MAHFLKFLETDLTPIILEEGTVVGSPEILDLISQGANSRIWILRVQNILQWSLLGWEEDRWLNSQGLDRLSQQPRGHGVWSRPSFLRSQGLSHDNNARTSLQLGRKLWRFEAGSGVGIVLLLVPVLPSLRRLSLNEEVRTVTLLQTEYTKILLCAKRLNNLTLKYRNMVHHLFLKSTPHAESSFQLASNSVAQ